MNYKPLKNVKILLAVLFTVSLIFSCGGGEDENTDGDTGPEQVAGEMFLGGDDTNYKVPHLFLRDSDTYITYRNEDGIYFKNLNINDQTKSMSLEGSAAPAYAVNQYAISNNYFVWNAGTQNTYRYQWATATTQLAKTDALAPGFCITKDYLDQDILASAHRGGYLYTIKLSKFSDDTEISNRSTLFDPENNGEQIQVQSFACSGSYGYVGGANGKLYSVNLRDNSPTLQGPITTGDSFSLLQVSGPIVVWVDAEGDIKKYDTSTPNTAPVVAVDVQYFQATSNIQDMRIFDNVVIWSDDSDGNYNIWGANLTAMKNVNDYVQITKEAGNERYPFVFQGQLYWEDDRNGFAEIFHGALPAF